MRVYRGLKLKKGDGGEEHRMNLEEGGGQEREGRGAG